MLSICASWRRRWPSAVATPTSLPSVSDVTAARGDECGTQRGILRGFNAVADMPRKHGRRPAHPGRAGFAPGQLMTAETQYVDARVAATAPATLLASQGNAYTPGGVTPPGVLGALSEGIIGYMIRWQLDTLPCGCALHGHPSNALGCLIAIRRSSGGQVKCNGPPLGRAVHPGLYAGSLQPAVFKGPV